MKLNQLVCKKEVIGYRLSEIPNSNVSLDMSKELAKELLSCIDKSKVRKGLIVEMKLKGDVYLSENEQNTIEVSSLKECMSYINGASSSEGILDETFNSINEDSGKFSQLQLREIRVGLTKGLDVSIYAKPEFSWWQMQEIRIGLVKGLDVSIYSKPEFSQLQMREIRYGLEKGLDVTVYAKPEFSFEQMRENVEKLLQEKLEIKDASKNIKPTESSKQIPNEIEEKPISLF